METFVSDLLESADLRVITKKDVRVKYKSFIGRDISAEEKSKINDLVYAFVSYHADKQKKHTEGKPNSGGSSPGDKENKQTHGKEKGTRDGQKVSTNKSPLTGQGLDKHNHKHSTKKNGSMEKSYQDKSHYHVSDTTQRKVYPARTGKESRRLKITEAVSAIMDTTNSDSSWSTDTDLSDTDTDSELELDAAEKLQLQLDVKKLQQARERRIKIAKDRKQKKKQALANKDMNGKDTSLKEDKLNKQSKDSKCVELSSEDSMIVLLSDSDAASSTEQSGQLSVNTPSKHTDSDQTNTKPGKSDHKPIKKSSDSIDQTAHKSGKSDHKQLKSDDTINKTESPVHKKSKTSDSGNCVSSSDKVKHKDKEDKFSKACSSEKIKKKKDKSVNKNVSSTSGDSSSYEVYKTPANYIKAHKLFEKYLKKDKVSDKKVSDKKVIDKKSKLKRNIVMDTDTESEVSTPVKKKPKMKEGSKNIKDQKKSSNSSDKSSKLSDISKGIKVKKKARIEEVKKKLSNASKNVTVKKKTSLEKKAKYFKVLKDKKGKKVLDSVDIKKLVKKKREEAAKKKLNSEHKGSDKTSKEKEKLKDAKSTGSKTLSSEEMKKLVKKKREIAAKKKLNREKKSGESKEDAIVIVSESQSEEFSESNSEFSDNLTLSALKSKMNKFTKLVISGGDNSDLNSSANDPVKDRLSIQTIDSDIDSVSSLSTLPSLTSSPVKPTNTQLLKKKTKKMASEEDGLHQGPSGSKKSKLHENNDGKISSNCGKVNKNGISIDSEDTSEDDEPLSQIQAKLKGPQPGEVEEEEPKEYVSPYLIELRQICAASGIEVDEDRDFRKCHTNGAKIRALRFLLREEGMKGLPNMQKAEELKQKKAAAAVDTSHILYTQTGRARRKVRSIYARLMKSNPNADTSETSDNDTSCLSETDGNEKMDDSRTEDSEVTSDIKESVVDQSESEESDAKDINLFERLKSLGDSESSE